MSAPTPLPKDQISTPRVDAVAFWITNEHARREAVFSDFARQLERELTEARRQLAEMEPLQNL